MTEGWRICLGLAFAATMIAGCGGQEEKQVKQSVEQTMIAKQDMKICKAQTYALCATARCNVYDGVAYCQCNVMSGNSISLPFKTQKQGDVCSVNAAGAGNRYMVSTYSLPHNLVKGGKQAVYDCPGGIGEGAYAQCDGGLCFSGSEGKSFPGFDKPIPKGQIMCACPVTTTGSGGTVLGHQIVGPYPCERSHFRFCNSGTANGNTGSTIYVGAPTGMVRNLAIKLNGTAPVLNECHMQGR